MRDCGCCCCCHNCEDVGENLRKELVEVYRRLVAIEWRLRRLETKPDYDTKPFVVFPPTFASPTPPPRHPTRFTPTCN